MSTLQKQRRKQEMLRFYAATALTLLSFKYLLGKLGPSAAGVKRPQFFQFNHRKQVGAGRPRGGGIVGAAAGGTLGITAGWMLMGLFGTCWCLDISSLDDLKGNDTEVSGLVS